MTHSEYFAAKKELRKYFFPWKKGDPRYRVIPYSAVQTRYEDIPQFAAPVKRALERVAKLYDLACTEHFYRQFNFRDILRHPTDEITLALAVTILKVCFQDCTRTRTLLRKLHLKLRQTQRAKYYPQEAEAKRKKRLKTSAGGTN